MTLDGKKLGPTTLTMTMTKESGLQNVSFVPFLAFTLVKKLLLNCFILGKILNNFATLSGKASVMLHGYTYTYVSRKPKKGQTGPCCRPTKQKCRKDKKSRNICKTTSGRTKCGGGCTRLIKALEGLQRKEERKMERRRKKKLETAILKQKARKPESKESESESFEEYSSEEEEYSNEEYQETGKKKEVPKQKQPYAKKGGPPDFRRSQTLKKQDKQPGGGEGMGLRVKKGQKLNHKQLNMLESASELRKTSTNPLCKEKPNLFR